MSYITFSTIPICFIICLGAMLAAMGLISQYGGAAISAMQGITAPAKTTKKKYKKKAKKKAKGYRRRGMSKKEKMKFAVMLSMGKDGGASSLLPMLLM